jgi:uncharacterized protein
MKGIVRAAGIAAIVLVALFYAARAFAFHEVEASGYHPPRAGTMTPASLNVRYEDVIIRSEERALRGWFVPATDPHAPAALIYHGDGETISDWTGALALLHRNGISTMIFDYSGYGASSGRPSYRNLDEDASAAYEAFLHRTPHAKRHVVVGLSLGDALILDADAGQPHLDGVVFTGAWGSVRSVVGRTGRFPSPLAFLLPDVYDNIAQAQHLRAALLVVEGGDDRVAPLHEAQAVEAAAAGPKQFVLRPGYGHNAPWQKAEMGFWAPIVHFISTGTASGA